MVCDIGGVRNSAEYHGVKMEWLRRVAVNWQKHWLGQGQRSYECHFKSVGADRIVFYDKQ